MNVVMLLAHSIEEYDQLRLLSSLGYDVFSIGAYSDPKHPGDDKRPPLPEVRYHPELAALVEGDQMAHKAHIPDGLLDWADVLIVHHFVDEWIALQWPRIRHKRVIWRTVGQSGPPLETLMKTLRHDGLQVVRYSPAERRAFQPMGIFAGEDALIRFWKDPDEWCGWTGEDIAVGNITQDMARRGDFCGLGFWQAATEGLPTRPAGPGSEALPGGVGTLSYDDMRAYLRRVRCYLYTGTQPASYTLGLIEAMMTGCPVISIPKTAMWIPELFEGDELAFPIHEEFSLKRLLGDENLALAMSGVMRQRAIRYFGRETVARQWAAFLGAP